MKYRLLTDKKGAVTIEAAVILPLLIAVFLFCFAFVDTFLAYNCASKAMYKTAYTASKYAVFYHKNGLKKITDSFKENNESDEGINSEKVGEFINADKILKYGSDKLYSFAADKLFKSEIEEDEIYNKYFASRMKWSFYDSDFFGNGDDISLNANFTCDYDIPFIGGLLKGFEFNKNVYVRTFMNGISTDSAADENTSIWSLTNFERGRKIEELFGGNLPDFFPVIDYYNNGVAMTILSIDHTKSTYLSAAAYRKKLEETAKKLYEFNGAEYKGIVVSGDSVRTKELLIVCPEDNLTDYQQRILDDFISEWNSKGIRVTVQRYQKTVQIDTEN